MGGQRRKCFQPHGWRRDPAKSDGIPISGNADIRRGAGQGRAGQGEQRGEQRAEQPAARGVLSKPSFSGAGREVA